MKDFPENDSSAGGSLLELAERVAETLHDQHPEVVEAIAIQYAQQGELERAIEIAEGIADPYSKDQALGIIAAFSVDTQGVDETSELLNSIQDPMLLEMALERVATRYAQRGHIAQAIETASQLADSEAVLGNVAVIAANRGLAAEARELAESLESPAVRASTLAQLAFTQAAGSQHEIVEQLVDGLNRAIAEIEFDDEKVDALVTVGSVYQALGQKELAIEKFNEAHTLLDALDEESSEGLSSNFDKDVALGQMVTGFAQLKSFDRADQILGEISDPFQFAHAAIVLATLYCDEGEESAINDLLSQAFEIGHEEGQYGESGAHQRDNLFAQLARANASCNRFEEAMTVASTIASVDDRLLALKSIGELAAKAGLESAWMSAATAIRDEAATVSYWLAMSNVFLQIGQMDQAQLAISRAIEYAESIGNAFDKCIALGEIGLRLSTTEQRQEAGQVFNRAISIIPSLNGSYLKARALVELAQKFGAVHHDLTDEQRQNLNTMVFELE